MPTPPNSPRSDSASSNEAIATNDSPRGSFDSPRDLSNPIGITSQCCFFTGTKTGGATGSGQVFLITPTLLRSLAAKNPVLIGEKLRENLKNPDYQIATADLKTTCQTIETIYRNTEEKKKYRALFASMPRWQLKDTTTDIKKVKDVINCVYNPDDASLIAEKIGLDIMRALLPATHGTEKSPEVTYVHGGTKGLMIAVRYLGMSEDLPEESPSKTMTLDDIASLRYKAEGKLSRIKTEDGFEHGRKHPKIVDSDTYKKASPDNHGMLPTDTAFSISLKNPETGESFSVKVQIDSKDVSDDVMARLLNADGDFHAGNMVVKIDLQEALKAHSNNTVYPLSVGHIDAGNALNNFIKALISHEPAKEVSSNGFVVDAINRKNINGFGAINKLDRDFQGLLLSQAFIDSLAAACAKDSEVKVLDALRKSKEDLLAFIKQNSDKPELLEHIKHSMNTLSIRSGKGKLDLKKNTPEIVEQCYTHLAVFYKEIFADGRLAATLAETQSIIRDVELGKKSLSDDLIRKLVTNKAIINQLSKGSEWLRVDKADALGLREEKAFKASGGFDGVLDYLKNERDKAALVDFDRQQRLDQLIDEYIIENLKEANNAQPPKPEHFKQYLDTILDPERFHTITEKIGTLKPLCHAHRQKKAQFFLSYEPGFSEKKSFLHFNTKKRESHKPYDQECSGFILAKHLKSYLASEGCVEIGQTLTEQTITIRFKYEGREQSIVCDRTINNEKIQAILNKNKLETKDIEELAQIKGVTTQWHTIKSSIGIGTLAMRTFIEKTLSGTHGSSLSNALPAIFEACKANPDLDANTLAQMDRLIDHMISQPKLKVDTKLNLLQLRNFLHTKHVVQLLTAIKKDNSSLSDNDFNKLLGSIAHLPGDLQRLQEEQFCSTLETQGFSEHADLAKKFFNLRKQSTENSKKMSAIDIRQKEDEECSFALYAQGYYNISLKSEGATPGFQCRSPAPEGTLCLVKIGSLTDPDRIGRESISEEMACTFAKALFEPLGLASSIPDTKLLNLEQSRNPAVKNAAYLKHYVRTDFISDFNCLAIQADKEKRSNLSAYEDASNIMRDFQENNPTKFEELCFFLAYRHIIRDFDGHLENFGTSIDKEGHAHIAVIDLGLGEKDLATPLTASDLFPTWKFTDNLREKTVGGGTKSPNHLADYELAYLQPTFLKTSVILLQQMEKERAALKESLRLSLKNAQKAFGDAAVIAYLNEWMGFKDLKEWNPIHLQTPIKDESLETIADKIISLKIERARALANIIKDEQIRRASDKEQTKQALEQLMANPHANYVVQKARRNSPSAESPSAEPTPESPSAEPTPSETSTLESPRSETGSSLFFTFDPIEPPIDPIEPPIDPIEPPIDPIKPPIDPIKPPINPIKPPIVQPLSSFTFVPISASSAPVGQPKLITNKKPPTTGSRLMLPSFPSRKPYPPTRVASISSQANTPSVANPPPRENPKVHQTKTQSVIPFTLKRSQQTDKLVDPHGTKIVLEQGERQKKAIEKAEQSVARKEAALARSQQTDGLVDPLGTRIVLEQGERQKKAIEKAEQRVARQEAALAKRQAGEASKPDRPSSR